MLCARNNVNYLIIIQRARLTNANFVVLLLSRSRNYIRLSTYPMCTRRCIGVFQVE
jgi:hypothetical protein